MLVKIKRECNCTRKLELPIEFECETKSDALKKAQEMLNLLKEKSCHTHNFRVEEKDGVLEIDSKLNTDNFL